MVCRHTVVYVVAIALVASLFAPCAEATMKLRTPSLKRDVLHLDIGSKIEVQQKPNDREGEDHGKPKVPKGSQLLTFPVGKKGEKIPVYWTLAAKNEKVEHAYIMMHGRLRNGDHYWKVMNDALKSAQKVNYGDANKESIVAAPQMYSERLNKGQFDEKTLAWGEANAWQAGGIATHPSGTNVTSMDALDAILDHFADPKLFPSLKNITMVGHGGGAQLMNRYAATGKDPEPRLYVRYVVGDPSSSPYFTEHRPVTDKSVANINTCVGYNNWRYGFADFPGTMNSKLRPKDYFKRYLNRDVVNIVGLQDVAPNGDQKCMAVLQGGQKRRDRNFSWWRYINSLAKTPEDLSGFPGNFSNLPDWSDVHNGSIGTRLAVVEGVSHDAAKIFSSKIGRSALFSRYEIDNGWRPAAWHKNRKAGKHGKGRKHGKNSKQGGNVPKGNNAIVNPEDSASLNNGTSDTASADGPSNIFGI